MLLKTCPKAELPCQQPVRGELLTRSSPIGPAEHDEGGSLFEQSGQYSRKMKLRLFSDSATAHVPACPAISSGETHRPRSVSSLLILLSAIVMCVVDCQSLEWTLRSEVRRVWRYVEVLVVPE